MKIYVRVSLFEEEVREPEALWNECANACCDGLIVGIRHAETLAAHFLDAVKFETQREMLQRLLNSRPPGLSLIPGPRDTTAMKAVKQLRDVEAIWLPPAASHQPELVQTAAGLGVPLLAAVNGLGPQGFEVLRKACEGRVATLCYLTRQTTKNFDMLMQLAWLRAKGYPVGLVTDDEVELQSAAALGAEVLVASRACVLKDDWRGIAARLRRIAEATRGIGHRPISQEEVDGLFECLPSLVAAKRLEPGKKVQIEDVAVKAVWRERRGLAPFMLKKVVGRRLRYGLEQDEPFTFGFLKETDDHA